MKEYRYIGRNIVELVRQLQNLGVPLYADANGVIGISDTMSDMPGRTGNPSSVAKAILAGHNEDTAVCEKCTVCGKSLSEYGRECRWTDCPTNAGFCARCGAFWPEYWNNGCRECGHDTQTGWGKKIRRRCEDALRKTTHPQELGAVAELLGVKTE